MRIHRSAHARDFTVLPNAVLRDRRLSFTARGLLEYLLSLPDGAKATIRSLAEQNPDGRQSIANAFEELERHGYFRVVRHKDAVTGRITTVTAVYDVPQVGRAAPEPAPPGPGGPGDQGAGENPSGKNPVQEPTLPAPAPGAGTPAAALLFRVIGAEPRLRVGVAEAAKLAPMVEEWLARGATERDLREALLPGLPRRIHSATGLLRKRLELKLPPPFTPATPPHRRHECARCQVPVREPGICRTCAGLAVPPPDTSTFVEAARRGAAAARAAMRGLALPVPAC